MDNVERYEMDISDLTALKAVLDYFKGPFAEWSVYFDFISGIDKMEKEEWLSFKANVYDFQTYILDWEKKIEKKEGKSYMFIRDQCELYNEIWPALKAMRGEGFQRNHWAELFDIIGIKKDRLINELTFKEILNKKINIKEKIDDIQFLA